jgi:hypothetical protein
MKINLLVEIYMFLCLDLTFDQFLKKSKFENACVSSELHLFGKIQGQNWNKKVIKNWAFIFFTLMRIKYVQLGSIEEKEYVLE